jgi:hypothetical protein
MHRNSLRRIVSDLELDVKAVRFTALRRSPQPESLPQSGKRERLYD